MLFDIVAGGASVSFMAGFTKAEALAWWRGIDAEVAAGSRVLFAAGDIDGTAQLILETPPNQPHRAELAKLLMHGRARHRGPGRALFEVVEVEAQRRGRTLLTFDTISVSAAGQLCLSCGCLNVGEIPGYALFPDGRPSPTSIFYKILGEGIR